MLHVRTLTPADKRNDMTTVTTGPTSERYKQAGGSLGDFGVFPPPLGGREQLAPWWPAARAGTRTRQPFRSLDHEPDADLVRLAASGRRDAWAALVKRFAPLVMRVARSVGLSEADAADVSQATWLRFMRSCQGIREPERIAGWLTTTARRESFRLAGASYRAVPVEDLCSESSSDYSEPGADEHALAAYWEGALERAFSNLPFRDQRLLRLLVDGSGASYRDIALTLDIPVGSIGPLRQRALAALRARLGNVP